MERSRPTRIAAALILVAGLVGIAACSGSSGGSSAESGAPQCDGAQEFASTFEGIQKTIFERHGCTEQVCHGSAASGGLNLSPEVAYDNLFDVPSLESPLKRIEPGDEERSFLWRKLAAKTRPGKVQIVGAPMPNNESVLSEDELELLRLWIYAGAPRDATVVGTDKLLGACLPPPEPITIKPLDPPAPGEGVQFVLPSIELAAHSEVERCFAMYYDVRDQVPPEMQDPTGRFFRYAGQELRQDPQSHHLVLYYSQVPVEKIHDAAFGAWTCADGETPGAPCEPTERSACGSGQCRSEVKPTVGCVGFGPPGSGVTGTIQLGGAQAPQAYQRLRDGVFAQVPMTGIVYWNPHAFNLTDRDHTLHGRMNFYFAKDQRWPIHPIFDATHVFSANAAPYTKQTICADHVLPQGTRLFGLTSHTHKRGKRFYAFHPDGTQIFENFIYNDPVKQAFDPPLEFDSPNDADRTIHFCADYNNGVAEDGSPDPEKVTRASRVPESARMTIGRCKPVACAAGQIGAPCDGDGDDAACDSSPGAGDGSCDACPITGGESTENEMFILIGQSYIDEHFPQPSSDGPLFGGLASLPPEGDPTKPGWDASGRSTYGGIAAVPSMGCSSAPGGHLGHAAHAAHGG
ncbi:MAG TPA: hypothetical protein VFD92_16935 [Candidatus Binatia bacterium]|nr:hypothetical protein [Candidatus Binatia bacterium]